MLVVQTPATVTRLCTLQGVKDDLSIPGVVEDAYLNGVIDAVSRTICDHLNIAEAEDGSSTLGRETLVETLDLDDCRRLLQLSRKPIVSVASITLDGVAVDAAEYEALKSSGMLQRLSEYRVIPWSVGRYVVSYVAGWKLPGEDGRNLPAPIERAAIDLVKLTRFGRKRDAMVKAEEIPDIERIEYWVGGADAAAIPPDVASRIERYIQERL